MLSIRETFVLQKERKRNPSIPIEGRKKKRPSCIIGNKESVSSIVTGVCASLQKVGLYAQGLELNDKIMGCGSRQKVIEICKEYVKIKES